MHRRLPLPICLSLGGAALALLLGCPSRGGGRGAGNRAPAPSLNSPETPKTALPMPPGPPSAPPQAVARPRPQVGKRSLRQRTRPSSPLTEAAPTPPSAGSLPVHQPSPLLPPPMPAPPTPAAPSPTSAMAASVTPPPTPAAAASSVVEPTPAAKLRPTDAGPSEIPSVAVVASTTAGPPAAEATRGPAPRSFGAQSALVFPDSPDLRLTSGSPSLSAGFHATWTFSGGQRVRPRVDYTVFTGRTQTSTVAPLFQTLDTRVTSLAFGLDWLLPILGRWSLGLGVSEVRWSVASTNRVNAAAGGTTALSGTARWWRVGLGPVLTFRVTERCEAEGRLLRSHYGYENQPANTAAVGLVWRF